MVCRCEEVTVGEMVEARDRLELRDPRSLKGSTRAGMGLCQGRICGFATSCIASEGLGTREQDVADAVSAARRPFALPLTLGALAEDSTAPGSTTGEVHAEPLPRSEERN